MPRGSKPLPVGEAKAPRNQVHKWKMADSEGWQHGDVPAAPGGLTEHGKRAWATWLGAWWASFYTPDDLPGLELTVRHYDAVMLGHLDIAKVVPLLDRYGITPKGRQDLRWARAEKPAESAAGDLADDLAKRRDERRSKLA